MKEVLDGIRAEVGAENCCRSCSQDGCRVFLDDVPRERVIVDAEKAFEARERHGKRCDFIVFLPRADGKLVAAPVELKSGGVDVSAAVQQLQGGAAFSECLVDKASGSVCRPILIHGHGLHPQDLRRLNRAKILFHGIPLTVRTERCGQPRNLANALGI